MKTQTIPSEERKRLSQELHGEEIAVSGPFRCDFCSHEITASDHVMYDALRLSNLPNLQATLDIPECWVLDAARCQHCETDTLDPTTNGIDEVLISLPIHESNGVLSADTSEVTILEYSPSTDGYHPPAVDIGLVLHYEDLGLIRWSRIEWILNNLPHSSPQVAHIQALADQSIEKPPKV